jgi:hypothetical protein
MRVECINVRNIKALEGESVLFKSLQRFADRGSPWARSFSQRSHPYNRMLDKIAVFVQHKLAA